ncbi:adenosylcobinamide-phosphate synthase [Nocardioides albertanoniae]|uniref:Cobalamin biosynthesis protein CobD n=1 Tax=Nocardioides albertanoniae TaxID=1175486 RepID=A0A543A4U6_9ACTN|nr:cobalamin biosynthesis protein [Nocardioides albertanoniae]TQL67623.1 adenosylcobinamide-phosphate synthase [Nocardioides albertanoniae]
MTPCAAQRAPRRTSGSTPRAVGILLGFVLDRLVGDPRRFHPVAGFGTVAARAERAWYADDRARGVLHTVTLVGGAVVLGAAAERVVPGRAGRMLLTAAATWAVLGGRSLEREALAVHAHLAADDLPAAREQVTRLVGRDTAALDASEVTRAVVESVAENTSDAVVAPLVWGAIGGVPGLLGYRAANTLDAMVGHHNERYERFGWASARLDDLLNLPGSRLSGVLATAAAPSGAGAAVRAWRRDAAWHPSPNAGVVGATFAGALGVRLGGTNTYYGTRVEHRAVMGDGRATEPADIPRSTRLARRVGIGAALVAAAYVASGRIRWPSRRSR